MALRTIHSTFFPELTSLGEIRRPSYPSGISPLDRPHLPATRLSRAAKVHYKLLLRRRLFGRGRVRSAVLAFGDPLHVEPREWGGAARAPSLQGFELVEGLVELSG